MRPIADPAYVPDPAPLHIAVIWGDSVSAGGPALAETARRLEGLGFSSLVMPDAPGQSSAVFPTLAWVAASTSTLGIGSWVLHTDLHHPLRLARDSAVLHALSGGRFTLGLGAGRSHSESDRRAFGVPLDPAGVRLHHLEETIATIDALFAGDEVTATVGTYGLEGAQLLVPMASGSPPLLVAGGGDRMLRLAARHADVIGLALDPLATDDVVRDRIAVVRAEADPLGRRPEFALSIAAVGDRVHPWLRPRLERYLAQGGAPVPALLSADPGALREGIQRLQREFGISRLVIAPEHVDPIAAVIPALR
ncbi:MAG: LLM class flavin-dependent oxidoreductase [Thermomicrobiales bacterium]